MQPKILHIGLYCSLLASCLPNCADETRTPVVKIPSISPRSSVTVAPIARDASQSPDVECLERGASNELRFVNVIVPSFDLAEGAFVDGSARVQIISARDWEPSPTLRVGWVIGRVTVSQPNGQLRSFLGNMGHPTSDAPVESGLMLPTWSAKHDVWLSDAVAVMFHRTGFDPMLLPTAGELDDALVTTSALWTLDDFLSFQLLQQDWMKEGMKIVKPLLSRYAGIVSFSAHAVELRDEEGSLGCAQVFNRR